VSRHRCAHTAARERGWVPQVRERDLAETRRSLDTLGENLGEWPTMNLDPERPRVVPIGISSSVEQNASGGITSGLSPTCRSTRIFCVGA
jgi:hypothetical protein